MGIAGWITLLGSIVIGSLVLVSFQQFNNDVSRDLFTDTLDNIANENLDDVVRFIQYDFSRIGLGINDPLQAVLTQADSSDLRYVMDSDGNGVPETMRYYLSDANDPVAASTSNPNDNVLYRQVNGGTPEAIATGIRIFKIQYFDAAGVETADLATIRTLVVNLTVESAYGVDNKYPRLVWQGRITPPNLVTY